MRRVLRLLMNRMTVLMLLVFIQIALFVLMILYLSSFWLWNVIFIVISLLIVLLLINTDDNPSYTIAWIIPIMLFPVVGGAFYLFYRYRNIRKKDRLIYQKIDAARALLAKDAPQLLNNRNAEYLQKFGWPTFQNTQTQYIASGREMFDKLLVDIGDAKQFIFLEFFIIKPGVMWDTLFEALKKKAEEGVNITIIYDDFGSKDLPFHFPKQMDKVHIHAYKFNRIRLRVNFANNYRNHRKIVIIDNNIGYATSNNIGDEYIGIVKPYGEWLDTGIRMVGAAVRSLTTSFLDTLEFLVGSPIDKHAFLLPPSSQESDGFLIPFSDTPIDQEEITKNIYLSMIFSAKKTIRVTTPYLIIDPEFRHALRLASKSGIQVNIIIPAIPDKKMIYMVTKSNLPSLMKDGVNIYVYSPGFIHSKMMIIDDERAMIGTANLDYRSLYLHFENSVYIEKSSTIQTMRCHFETIQTQSRLLTEKDKDPILYRAIQAILRLFASLM